MNFRRLHPVPLVAGVAVAVLTVQLGNWQVRRAHEKTALQERIDAGAAAPVIDAREQAEVADWRTVTLAGRWQAERTIFLDNRVRDGRVGYEVLTPLRLDGEGVVLVNRGWTAGDPARRVLPEVVTKAEPVAVVGTVRRPAARPFTLADEPSRGPLWQYLDVARYRDWSGLPVRDWIVQQTSAAPDGLERDWPRPDAGIDRHRGYALQWYSLAGLSLVMTGTYVVRRLRT